MTAPASRRSAPAPARAAVCEVLRLPARVESVALARAQVKASLAAVCLDQACDDAGLVVSELLGNALRHARPITGGLLVLGWQIRADQVEIRVTDGGSTDRRIAAQDEVPPTAISGRGLRIVQRLAIAWGVHDHVGGLRTVWAQLPVQGGRGLRVAR